MRRTWLHRGAGGSAVEMGAGCAGGGCYLAKGLLSNCRSVVHVWVIQNRIPRLTVAVKGVFGFAQAGPSFVFVRAL